MLEKLNKVKLRIPLKMKILRPVSLILTQFFTEC